MADAVVKKSLKDFKEDAYRCSFNCFNCTIFSPQFMPSCPAFEKYGFYAYASRGRAGIIEAYLAGKIAVSEEMAKIFYACSLCGACRVSCQQAWSEYNLEAFVAMREEILEKGFAPAKLRDALKSIQKYSNPYGVPAENRGEWANGLGVEEYAGQEYLLYIGDEGSLDTAGQKMARSLVKVLQKAKVSFGILGNREISDGYEVKVAGETGLYEYLVEQNIELFNELDIKKVVALSPHAYYAFKHDYPQYGASFEAIHYTQLLNNLIKSGQIKPSAVSGDRVFYHDPCYLGRFSEEYEASRKILQAVPGLELISLPRERDKAFCCGGGGSNLYTDLLTGGAVTPGRMRIREICAGNANIVAVACPICSIMLGDAIKAEFLDEKIKVMDISEILLASLG